MLVGAALAAAPVAPAHGDPACGDATVVFVRGSGQQPGAPEATRYLDEVAGRVGGTLTRHEVDYPAARWEDGHYGASVAQGVANLRGFLVQRSQLCPGERFLIGGYSQGAQVTGEALFGLPAPVLERLAHVSLFGDPNLYLPEGRGPFPPACRGAEFSPWRRGSVGCLTDNGFLGARVPYLPAEMVGRTGSWCDREDPICNGNPADFAGSAHDDYWRPGAEIDEAAAEADRAFAREYGPPGR